MGVPRQDADRYYEAAVIGLAALDAVASQPRRFGVDADARWKSFRGSLEVWDRIDLLIRDASVVAAAGFAPRVVFALPDLADDEPFGPTWPGPDPSGAVSLWERAAPIAAARPLDLGGTLARIAKAWGLTDKPLRGAALGTVTPTTQLALVGAPAILATAAAFANRRDLDLADQSVLLADTPGERQLYGMTLALLGSRRPARLASFDATVATLAVLGVTRLDRIVIDHADSSLTAAQRTSIAALGRALGAT